MQGNGVVEPELTQKSLHPTRQVDPQQSVAEVPEVPQTGAAHVPTHRLEHADAHAAPQQLCVEFSATPQKSIAALLLTFGSTESRLQMRHALLQRPSHRA